MIDKLLEECTENVDGVKIDNENENENKHKCSSCILYILLFLIILTINIGIATYFVYSHWYLKKDNARVILDTSTETTIY